MTCHWSGTVAVDHEGEAIGNSIIWMDSRGAPQVAEAVGGRVNVMGYDPRRLARWIQLTGGAPSHSGKDSLAHILWLKDQRPEVYDAAERLLEPADYLNLRLTGRAVTSHDCAVMHWLTDNRDRDDIHYDPQLLAWTGRRQGQAPARWCPRPRWSGRCVDEVAEAGASRRGAGDHGHGRRPRRGRRVRGGERLRAPPLPRAPARG